MMRHFFLKTSLALLLCGNVCLADSTRLSIQLEPNPGFASDFIPGFEQLDHFAIYLSGLAKHYPGVVLDIPPPMNSVDTSREPLVMTLGRGIVYLRAYSLAHLVEATYPEDSKHVIFDARYLRTPWFRGTPVHGLTWTRLADSTYELDAVTSLGKGHFILINHQTAGLVEAYLSAQKRLGDVVLVGKTTAGITGSYRKVECASGATFWMATHSLHAKGGESLLGAGVTPHVSVTVDPEADYHAYYLVENGVAPYALLNPSLPRFFKPETTEASESPEGESELESTDPHSDEASQTLRDPILQRAVEIIIALQLLGDYPLP